MHDSIGNMTENIGGVKTTDCIEDHGIIKPKGHVVVTSKDLDGNIIQQVESDNLVVNTGISSLVHALAGSPISGNPIAGSEAYIKYMVLGTSNSAPAAGDTLGSFAQVDISANSSNGGKSIFGDRGASKQGAITVALRPNGANIANSTGLLFTLDLQNGEGNGSGASTSYEEGGLLWGVDSTGSSTISASSDNLILFSRVTFAPITKNSTRSISLEWTFSLTG